MAPVPALPPKSPERYVGELSIARKTHSDRWLEPPGDPDAPAVYLLAPRPDNLADPIAWLEADCLARLWTGRLRLPHHEKQNRYIVAPTITDEKVREKLKNNILNLVTISLGKRTRDIVRP